MNLLIHVLYVKKIFLEIIGMKMVAGGKKTEECGFKPSFLRSYLIPGYLFNNNF